MNDVIVGPWGSLSKDGLVIHLVRIESAPPDASEAA